MYAVTVHVCEHFNCIEAVGFREWSDHICCDLLPWLLRDVVRIKWDVQGLLVDFVFLTFDAPINISSDHFLHLRPPIISLNELLGFVSSRMSSQWVVMVVLNDPFM